MKVSKSPIDGLIIIEPKVFRDSRGLFYEVYSESRYKEHGVSARLFKTIIPFLKRECLGDFTIR